MLIRANLFKLDCPVVFPILYVFIRLSVENELVAVVIGSVFKIFKCVIFNVYMNKLYYHIHKTINVQYS